MKLSKSNAGGRQLLFSFLCTHWKASIVTVLLDFLANGCVVGISLVLAQAIASTFGFQSIRGSLLWGIQKFDMWMLLSLFGSIIFVKLLLDYGRLRFRGILTEKLVFFLRTRLFDHHLQTELGHHEMRDAGRSLLRFSGDLSSIQRLLSRGVFQFAADLSLISMGFVLVAILGGHLALFIGLFGLLGWGLILLCNRKLKGIEKKRRGKKSDLLAFVSSSLLNLAGIQALNRNTRIAQRFKRKAEKVRDIGYQYHKIAALSASLPLFFVQILLLLALVLGWWFGLSGQSQFTVILILMTWRTPLSRFFSASLVWKKGFLSLDRVAYHIQRPLPVDSRQKEDNQRFKTLQLLGVSFSMGNRTILKDLSFQLSKGEVLCIAATTGGGKTTLSKMLAGLYPITSGKISLEETPLAELPSKQLRRLLSFVSEAFPLYGHTLLDALSPSGQPAALAKSREEFLRWQTKFPSLHGLEVQHKFNHLPPFSSGQQRILQCLRAYLANKPFLILDEPFIGLEKSVAIELSAMLQENQAQKAILILSAQPAYLSELGWGNIHTINL